MYEANKCMFKWSIFKLVIIIKINARQRQPKAVKKRRGQAK